MDKAGKELGEMQKDKASDSQEMLNAHLILRRRCLAICFLKWGKTVRRGKATSPVKVTWAS